MTLEQMKARKRELGYSNREISERSGVPFGTVQKIFGGLTAAPRHDTIVALEKVLSEEGSEGEVRGSYKGMYTPEGTDVAGAYTSRISQESFASHSGVVRDSAAEYGITHYGSSNKRQGEYTIEDWENLPDDVRAELINGQLYYMATPVIVHQELVSVLTREFWAFIRSHHGDCRVFPAPTGDRIFKDNKTMLEPDISVICDREKITRKWMEGAPDLVVEILSPSNRKHDMVTKLNLYEEGGVREYWIVDPKMKRIIVYDFNDATVMHIYTFQDKVPVAIWEGKCVIDFAQISQEIAYLADDEGNFQ